MRGIEIVDIEAFETRIEDIPPASQLINATDDQATHWRKTKIRYTVLRQLLTAYFSGERVDITGYTQLQKEFFLLDRDYWITFYKLISDGWEYIEAAALENEISLEAHEIHTPGLMLAEAIRERACLHASPAFEPYYRWTPSKTRNDLKLYKEASELLQKEAHDHKEQRKIREAQKSWDSLQTRIQPYTNIERLCEWALKSRKDKRTKKNLGALKEAESNITKFFNRNFLHPRKGVKGYEFRGGKKFSMSKYGGKTT